MRNVISSTNGHPTYTTLLINPQMENHQSEKGSAPSLPITTRLALGKRCTPIPENLGLTPQNARSPFGILFNQPQFAKDTNMGETHFHLLSGTWSLHDPKEKWGSHDPMILGDQPFVKGHGDFRDLCVYRPKPKLL